MLLGLQSDFERGVDFETATQVIGIKTKDGMKTARVCQRRFDIPLKAPV